MRILVRCETVDYYVVDIGDRNPREVLEEMEGQELNTKHTIENRPIPDSVPTQFRYTVDGEWEPVDG